MTDTMKEAIQKACDALKDMSPTQYDIEYNKCLTEIENGTEPIIIPEGLREMIQKQEMPQKMEVCKDVGFICTTSKGTQNMYFQVAFRVSFDEVLALFVTNDDDRYVCILNTSINQVQWLLSQSSEDYDSFMENFKADVAKKIMDNFHVDFYDTKYFRKLFVKFDEFRALVHVLYKRLGYDPIEFYGSKFENLEK